MADDRYDILGFGCVAVDELLYVDRYPGPDAKTRIDGKDRSLGGLAGASLITGARLGARCAYAGILGRDDLSQYALDVFKEEGVSTQTTPIVEGARPAHSVIIVDRERQTRNIFFDLDGVTPPAPESIDPALVCSTAVLFVDHFGVEGMTRAVSIAREAGIPIVADFERFEFPGFLELEKVVDHLIVSKDYALAFTGAKTAEEAVSTLWNADREVVVVTTGPDGGWYRDRSHGSSEQFEAFEVETLDTTGCGDVFHGAYAVGLTRGLDVAARLRFAAAAAALKASRRGGHLAIPTREEVEAFIQARRDASV